MPTTKERIGPFRPLSPRSNQRRRVYASELAAIRNTRASGVYVILDARSGQTLYVGESHTGRLYDTLTRHFRHWTGSRGYADGRPRGGTSYDPARVRVAYTITRDEEAQPFQYATIQELRPRDNENDCRTCAPF